MKTDLAMRLIAEQMQWTDDAEATIEFARLKLMIDYKYDHYHGFQPGSRFYVALIGWLSQFEMLEERKIAYQFLKVHLIFISQREMHHLVGLLMPIIDRELRAEVAGMLGINLWETWFNKPAVDSLRLMQKRTLYIALSDGARIDVFRRFNEGVVSNEQVLASSDFSEDKWDDLIENLQKALKETEKLNEDQAYFERICLIDDFTGSGSSLLRFEDGKWKGKVPRFCKLYKKYKSKNKFPSGKPLPIQIHHHLASNKACIEIDKNLHEFSKVELDFKFTTTYSYRLPPDIVISDSSEANLVKIIRQYYDKKIEDAHTKNDIWFGYRQCGLPLVLDHNTPNNSVALLWAESPEDSNSKHKMKPLFIRRKRHSSHG